MYALGDITILDLSHALAGPFASTLLGDYGAEVIKIEPLEGEIARGWESTTRRPRRVSPALFIGLSRVSVRTVLTAIARHSISSSRRKVE